MTDDAKLGWAPPVPRWRDPRQWFGLIFWIVLLGGPVALGYGVLRCL